MLGSDGKILHSGITSYHHKQLIWPRLSHPNLAHVEDTYRPCIRKPVLVLCSDGFTVKSLCYMQVHYTVCRQRNQPLFTQWAIVRVNNIQSYNSFKIKKHQYKKRTKIFQTRIFCKYTIYHFMNRDQQPSKEEINNSRDWMCRGTFTVATCVHNC